MALNATPLVAIVGRPNVGKSSLFNRLVGARLAITHDSAGTTRDANYAPLSWNGRHFTLVDTAGLSKAEDDIELQVQDQINEISAAAAVLVVVVDAATMITNEDQAAARLALKSGKPVVLALNKIDTAANADLEAWRRLGLENPVGVSAIHGRGTGDLLDAVAAHLHSSKPQADAQAPLRLAFIGRPNVGKSSLVNNLLGKQAAVVSSTPGTTRDTSHARIKYKGRDIELIDTAGLRRRGRIAAGVEKFSSLRTLGAINQADICVLVMDATEGAVSGDLSLAGQIAEAGRGLILAMNKWDAVEKDEKTQDHATAVLRHEFQFVWWAPLVYTSAEQGLHTNQLMELAIQVEEHRHTSIATGPLNRLLEKLVAAHPPAGHKSRQPKINYVTQTGTNPPVFTFFATHPDLIHFSYRRYLENHLREDQDFTGTPISLEFKAKHTDRRKGSK
jgi:GTP-binding protein